MAQSSVLITVFSSSALSSQGGLTMKTPYTARRTTPPLSRRELLQAGLAAGVTLSIRPLSRPPLLWGGETGHPKRGGILRVRGYDPTHFDPHLTISFTTHST